MFDIINFLNVEVKNMQPGKKTEQSKQLPNTSAHTATGAGARVATAAAGPAEPTQLQHYLAIAHELNEVKMQERVDQLFSADAKDAKQVVEVGYHSIDEIFAKHLPEKTLVARCQFAALILKKLVEKENNLEVLANEFKNEKRYALLKQPQKTLLGFSVSQEFKHQDKPCSRAWKELMDLVDKRILDLKVKNDIENVRAKLAELKTKLGAVNPVALTDEEYKLLYDARQDEKYQKDATIKQLISDICILPNFKKLIPTDYATLKTKLDEADAKKDPGLVILPRIEDLPPLDPLFTFTPIFKKFLDVTEHPLVYPMSEIMRWARETLAHGGNRTSRHLYSHFSNIGKLQTLFYFEHRIYLGSEHLYANFLKQNDLQHIANTLYGGDTAANTLYKRGQSLSKELCQRVMWMAELQIKAGKKFDLNDYLLMIEADADWLSKNNDFNEETSKLLQQLTTRSDEGISRYEFVIRNRRIQWQSQSVIDSLAAANFKYEPPFDDSDHKSDMYFPEIAPRCYAIISWRQWDDPLVSYLPKQQLGEKGRSVYPALRRMDERIKERHKLFHQTFIKTSISAAMPALSAPIPSAPSKAELVGLAAAPPELPADQKAVAQPQNQPAPAEGVAAIAAAVAPPEPASAADQKTVAVAPAPKRQLVLS